MKRNIILIAVLVIITIISLHSEEWVNYGNHNLTYCSVQDGSYLWVGSISGLVKINTITGQKTYFDKTNSGISGLSVSSLAIDNQGVLWIGTSLNGLCRFNGTTCDSWNTSNSNIPCNSINGIAFDVYNNCWIATDAGLGKFSNNSWSVWNETNSDIPSEYLDCIAIDTNGTKWIGNYESLFSMSGNSFNIENPNSGVSEIVIDNQGTKWFGFYELGLGKLSGATWTYYNVDNSDIPGNEVRHIATNGNGVVWLDAYPGITRFDGMNWTTWETTDTGYTLNQIKTIELDGNSRVWIGTRFDGLIKFDGIVWEMFGLSNAGIFWPKDINVIAIDSQNRKWIGTENGLTRYADGSWHTWGIYNPNEQLLIDVANVAVDNDNVVWLDSDTGSNRNLYSYDGSVWTLHTAYEFGLNSLDIECVQVDNQNNKWIGTENKLIKFNANTYIVFDSSNSPITSRITDVVSDAYGIIWVSTWGAGLLQYSGSNWTAYNTSNSNIPSDQIWGLSIDNSGNKWLGTLSGLCRFDDSNFTTWNMQNSDIPGDNVSSIAIKANNKVWLISGNNQYNPGTALSCLNGGTWTTWTNTNSPLPASLLKDVAIDAHDNKWITTDEEGIYVFNEDVIVANNDDTIPSPPQNYVMNIFPNPFRTGTNVSFSIPRDAQVTIKVFNTRGQLVRTLVRNDMSKGTHQINWDGIDGSGKMLASGIYIIQLESSGENIVQKVMLLK